MRLLKQDGVANACCCNGQVRTAQPLTLVNFRLTITASAARGSRSLVGELFEAHLELDGLYGFQASLAMTLPLLSFLRQSRQKVRLLEEADRDLADLQSPTNLLSSPVVLGQGPNCQANEGQKT